MKLGRYIAVDFGAESARVMLGTLSSGRLDLEEVYRFPTGGITIQGELCWDIPGFFNEVKKGLQKIGERKIEIESLSVDSWAVDYVYFNRENSLISKAFHYRNPRTQEFFESLTFQDRNLIFQETGIQFMALNTLCQLMADQQQRPEVFNQCDSFLMIADYFHYLLCGKAVVDCSNASTSQVYNVQNKKWSSVLQMRFNLPEKIFPSVVSCGTVLGKLKKDLCRETGLSPLQIIATCSHDTAAAVAAVPAEGKDWAYLSSGTWSLMGIELPKPLIHSGVQEANFTNEIGYGSSIRFLKNIVGLWILQECKREWDREEKGFSYAFLNEAAHESENLRSLIHPASPRFLEAGDMIQKIRDYCSETHQPIPETPGQITRCILESLALLYASTLEQIRLLTGKTISVLHIVGGGSQSQLLNQFAANACGIPVMAGPVEATATGNILLQSLAMGHLSSLDELRKVVRTNGDFLNYQPQEIEGWKKARERFQQLKK